MYYFFRLTINLYENFIFTKKLILEASSKILKFASSCSHEI